MAKNSAAMMSKRTSASANGISVFTSAKERRAMKEKPGTSLLRRLGKKGQGIRKRLSQSISGDANGNGNASLDDTAIMDEDEFDRLCSDSQPQEPEVEADPRQRTVKFLFPEVTEVQISYRVPDEDKYRFYYTKQNIAFFKREYDLERQPSCTDTVRETLLGLLTHYDCPFIPQSLALENGSGTEDKAYSLQRRPSPMRRSARSIRNANLKLCQANAQAQARTPFATLSASNTNSGNNATQTQHQA